MSALGSTPLHASGLGGLCSGRALENFVCPPRRTRAKPVRERCFAQSDDKDFAKRGGRVLWRDALAGCSGGMLWRGCSGGLVWRGALAECSGGEASKRPGRSQQHWRDALAGKPARSQEEASKRPAKGQEEASKRPGRGQESPEPSGMLWRMLWRDALAGCSGGVLWRGGQQEARKKLARGQQEASKRPARSQQEARKAQSRAVLWRGAWAGCSGKVLWRAALAGCSGREASKRPGRS